MTRVPYQPPPALCPGARVSLVSPAGPATPERIEAALAMCRSLGLEPVPGANARRRQGYLAGGDAERLADLDAAIRDPSTVAIWAIRGGYGTMRLIDRLDLAPLVDRPKAFIGFSDNTTIHLALARRGIASFHAPHAGGAFPEFTRRRFEDLMFRADAAGPLPMPDPLRPATVLVRGTAEGRLIGGNLALLAAACGTPVALDARDAIVAIEDVNEPPYRVDRALTQLRLAGALDGAAGFAFGRFTFDGDADAGNSAGGNGPTLHEVLYDRVADLGVPVVAELPFGHVDEQWTLPLGRRVRLDGTTGTLEILEPAVT